MTRLRYVNANRVEALERLGILRVRMTFLLNVPHRYLDFPISVVLYEWARGRYLTGRVASVGTKRPKMVV